MARRRSLVRLLRSRHLAAWLLAGIALWAAVGTTGLGGAYSFPPFLAAIALLFVSTALCAWERTAGALRSWRERGMLSEARLSRLRERPSVSISAMDGSAALSQAGHAFERLHLSVTRGPRLLEGSSGRWGLFGSPLFHVSLALLIALVALGQLTRSEGAIGIPEGQSRPEVAESYGVLTEGPLYGGHTGLDVAVSDMKLGYVVDGVDRGPAPVVTLSRDGEVVARQRVYPNRPLRHGSLLIHMGEQGFAPVIVLQDASGIEIARETFLADLDETALGGVTPVEFALVDAAGSQDRYTGRLTLALPRAGEATGTATLEVYEGDRLVVAQPIVAGQVVDVPSGDRLVLASVGLYARLTIADDWSVPWIYTLFGLAVVGLALAMLVPYRRVHVLLIDEGDGSRVQAVASHSRRDPTWRARVEGALREAIESGGAA